MLGVAIKAVGVGLLLYGLGLSARNGLNKVAARRRENSSPHPAA